MKTPASYPNPTDPVNYGWHDGFLTISPKAYTAILGTMQIVAAVAVFAFVIWLAKR